MEKDFLGRIIFRNIKIRKETDGKLFEEGNC